MKRVKSLVFKRLAQISCQSQATHLGNAGLEEPVESGAVRPRINQLDFPEEHQDPFPYATPRPSIITTRPSQPGHYVLHSNGYTDHTPEPVAGTVTYSFNHPVKVTELEMIVHINGITRVEGLVGDTIDELISIGEASASEAGRGKPFPQELGLVTFAFAPKNHRKGKIFRFVVRETVKVDGYANYQAYPRTADHERISPTLELVPDAPSPMSPFAKFCQAMMNLNEFFLCPLKLLFLEVVLFPKKEIESH